MTPRPPVLLLALALAGVVALPAQEAVDLPRLLSAHDLIWATLPDSPASGALSGNGVASACLFATAPDNRIDLQLAHAAGDGAPSTGPTRSATGRLLFRPTGWLLQGEMRTDLWNAETTARIETNLGLLRVRLLTLRERSVHLVELATTEHFGDGRAAGWEWEFRPDGAAGDPAAPRLEEGVAFSERALPNGTLVTTAWREYPAPDGRASRLFVATRHGHSAATTRREAVDAVLAAAATPLDELLTAHRNWWWAHYRRALITIPAPRLDRCYWRGIHHLASHSPCDPPPTFVGEVAQP